MLNNPSAAPILSHPGYLVSSTYKSYKMPKLVVLIAITLALHAHASPTEAKRIERSYEIASETWALKLKIAKTPEEKQALWENRPDPASAAAELWSNIAPFLKQDWTIPYSAFFLNITRNLTKVGADGNVELAFSEERQRIIKAFTENHLKKPGIGPFSIALVDSGDPHALPLLEKIITENPDEITKGVAALGASLLLKKLGDAPEVMKKRLDYLRMAIIQAADQQIGDTSIADIASDELYVIRYLSKGRAAPDFSGTDVAGRVIRLSNFKGKVTVVLFWDAKTADTDKVIRLTNQLAEKHAGKPVEIIGVTPEPLGRIRELQADGSIKWNNIIDSTEKISAQYKISNRPFVFVLDVNGNIQYTGLPGSFLDLTVDALLAGGAAKK